jgi:acetoin utilization protein AcuC
MECTTTAIWDEGYLAYDFGEHPLNPVRLDLTVRLARELGVLERLDIIAPVAADDTMLLTSHSADYIAAVKEAGANPDFSGFGMGTTDDPVFHGMYEAAALIAGGSVQAADAVWSGRTLHSVNIAGGLHHAMRGYASGFCIFNDIVVAIRALLAAGASKVAYVDIDVHHGDGVQAAFYDDPRVLTVSLHQDPRTLFPGTGLATEVGDGAGIGTAVNVALPPGTNDSGWLRAFHAVVPGVIRAFKPDVLVTQCGCDTHHEDPLANLELSIDGQRAAIVALHALAHEVTGGKWVAFGGGGYGLIRCVPRTWTHLLAESSGVQVDVDTPIPPGWTAYLRERGVKGALPLTMGEGQHPTYRGWEPGGDTWLDRAVGHTRRSVFPYLGLDPDDPRD